jgi:hypothetical protein
MRQSHAAGDKLFADYAGDGVPVVVDRSLRSTARPNAHGTSVTRRGAALLTNR